MVLSGTAMEHGTDLKCVAECQLPNGVSPVGVDN